MKSELIQPSVRLLESMRSVGYSFEAAVADILDNSITAGAKHIEIDADVGEGKFLAILDDGHGMSSDVAREALRFAGSSGKRDSSDLGRFGLGLKTASLSQARCLTVATMRDGILTALRWDVDFVHESGAWLLNVLDESDASDLPFWGRFKAMTSGTLVVWSQLDLLLGDTPTPGIYLAKRLNDLRARLSLVFHRFLAGGPNRVAITVNGIALQPIDPFLSANPKTQRTLRETLQIDGSDVYFQAFTLPHPSGLTPDERKRGDLGEGMRAAQGFYVYRNRRLISHGHWYGMASKNELSKQTRVKVDVPATLDALWQLDIMKSRAEPPTSFKTRLKQLLEPILASGRRVHTFRGRRETAEDAHVWSKIKTREGFGYEVNVENPYVKSILAQLNNVDAQKVLRMVQTIATTFPVHDAYVEIAANGAPLAVEQPREILIARLDDIRKSGVLSDDPAVVVTQLGNVEPFSAVKELRVLVDLVWERNDDAE